MEQAKELFNKIETIKNGDEFVKFCSETLGPIERIHFDFKEKHDSRDAVLHDDDRKNLSKAISGYANSGGGILIWGIEDKKIKPKPINNVQQFVKNLLEIASQVTDPIVRDIDGFAIISNGQTGEGYGIILVPESLLPPHRVILNLNEVKNHYFVRSGNSFNAASHTMLEDMFGRRPKPNLEINIKVKHGGSGGKIQIFQLIIAIENIGRGSAKSPFLAVKVNTPYNISEYGVDGNMHFGLPKLFNPYNTQEHRYGSTESFVIHPGITHEVTAIRLEIDLDKLPFYPDVVIDYKIAAEGIQLIENQQVFRIDDLFNPNQENS